MRGRNKPEKQRKQQRGGQAAIYQFLRVWACLRLISPSHSSQRPPCYEAIMWIFMKSDPYQQKKQAHCTHCLLPCFSISSTLQPSILSSFTHLHMCISHVPSLTLRVFSWLRIHLYIFEGSHFFLLQHTGCVSVCWYNGMTHVKGHEPAQRTQRLPTGCSSATASWGTSCCQK